jgi:excisionase family DNA binding protein
VELLTISEAAEALRCSPSMVRKLCKMGGLPFVSVGSRRVIRESDLHHWVEQHVQGNGQGGNGGG